MVEGAAVGLYMDRSIDYVAAMLGILKANAAVVPLPPSYPEARLREILAFARLDAVIAGETPLLPRKTRRSCRSRSFGRTGRRRS